MSRHEPPSGDYYYTAGQAVQLTPDDDWVAVDTRRGAPSDTTGSLQVALRESSRPLRGDLLLVRRDALSDRQLDALARRGAVHPVFHSEGAMLVALPEVRVEEPSPERRRALHRWLHLHANDTEIVNETGGRIVLRPASGGGRDALDLANHLTEEVGPEMAQPRFLRVVERFEH
jgi:hypothetical protein